MRTRKDPDSSPAVGYYYAQSDVKVILIDDFIVNLHVETRPSVEW